MPKKMAEGMNAKNQMRAERKRDRDIAAGLPVKSLKKNKPEEREKGSAIAHRSAHCAQQSHFAQANPRLPPLYLSLHRAGERGLNLNGNGRFKDGIMSFSKKHIKQVRVWRRSCCFVLFRVGVGVGVGVMLMVPLPL